MESIDEEANMTTELEHGEEYDRPNDKVTRVVGWSGPRVNLASSVDLDDGLPILVFIEYILP